MPMVPANGLPSESAAAPEYRTSQGTEAELAAAAVDEPETASWATATNPMDKIPRTITIARIFIAHSFIPQSSFSLLAVIRLPMRLLQRRGCRTSGHDNLGCRPEGAG